MERNLCWYYNTKAGCRNGDHCPYVHKKKDPSHVPKCRNYRGPGTCRYGDKCFFQHEEEMFSIASNKQPPKSPAAMVDSFKYENASPDHQNSLLFSNSNENMEHNKFSEVTSKERKKYEEGCKKSPKGHERFLSVKINNTVEDDSTPIKSAKLKVNQVSGAEGDSNNNAVVLPNHVQGETNETNQNTEPRTLTCGECGTVLEDYQSEEDELDALEKHYKENFLKMNKDHLKFLEKDNRFKFNTSCGVCGRDFMKTHSLLRHITDKVKSKKNDWKDHEDFLESIVTGFWERDIGLTDASECMDWLLLHLVESYEGEDTDSDSSDDDCGIGTIFGLLALNKHMGISSHNYEDDDSPDSNDYGNPWGMDDNDIYELACQGIKPWDPEAGAALAVLNGGDDFDFY